MYPQSKIPLFQAIVSKVEEIAKDVFMVSIPRTESFRAGQMLAVALKSTNQPRLYSIASGENDEHYRILFNVQAEGYLTPRLAKIKPGDSLFVSKPFGSFYGTKEADWWIAAGTGIAPFISMMETGLAENKTLIHGGRTLASFYKAEAFSSLLGNHYIRCSSLEKAEGIFQGRLTSYLKKLHSLSKERNYYVCGSSEFVVDVRDVLIDKGIAYDHIIAEIYF